MSEKFKVGDRITWGTQQVSGVVSRIDGENVFFFPELWQWTENGSHWQPSLDVIPLSVIMDNGFKIVEPKKEDKMQEIEVGSRWVSDIYEVKVVYISNGKHPYVFFTYDDASGGCESVLNFLAEFKPWTENPKVLTRWTYVHKYGGKPQIDENTYATDEEAEDDCALNYGLSNLVEIIKIEWNAE